MNTYAHWSTDDWLAHYAPEQEVVRHAQTGHPVARGTHQVGATPWGHVETCPSSLKPLLLLGALGFVGWKVFSPKVRETAKDHGWGSSIDKKAAGLAGLAASTVSRATVKIGEGAQSLSQRAERFARRG